MSSVSAETRVVYLIRWAMRNQAVTQRELAGLAGISEKHMSQLMTGKVRMSLELAEVLLANLGFRLIIDLRTATEEESIF